MLTRHLFLPSLVAMALGIKIASLVTGMIVMLAGFFLCHERFSLLL
ncbi:hypothetical protein [Alsobacter metallidurans]|nr:hypothetical protein [Alsobacter metallidurans]